MGDDETEGFRAVQHLNVEKRGKAQRGYHRLSMHQLLVQGAAGENRVRRGGREGGEEGEERVAGGCLL